MKTKTFKTAEELVKFVKEFWEEHDLYADKVLDVNYYKLTAVIRLRNKNRSVENESTTYLYRDMGANDSLSLMKKTEKSQYPSDTSWMLKLPITIKKEKEGK